MYANSGGLVQAIGRRAKINYELSYQVIGRNTKFNVRPKLCHLTKFASFRSAAPSSGDEVSDFIILSPEKGAALRKLAN